MMIATPSTSSVASDFWTLDTSKKRFTMSVGLRPSKHSISAWAKCLAKASAVRTKIRRCRHSATNNCRARSVAASARNANITSDSTTTGQSWMPKATVLTRASMAAGVTIESTPTATANARIVVMSDRSRRSTSVSRRHGPFARAP